MSCTSYLQALSPASQLKLYVKIENSIPRSLDQKSVYYIESLASMEFWIECAKHFCPSPKSENRNMLERTSVSHLQQFTKNRKVNTMFLRIKIPLICTWKPCHRQQTHNPNSLSEGKTSDPLHMCFQSSRLKSSITWTKNSTKPYIQSSNIKNQDISQVHPTMHFTADSEEHGCNTSTLDLESWSRSGSFFSFLTCTASFKSTANSEREIATCNETNQAQ